MINKWPEIDSEIIIISLFSSVGHFNVMQTNDFNQKNHQQKQQQEFEDNLQTFLLSSGSWKT